MKKERRQESWKPNRSGNELFVKKIRPVRESNPRLLHQEAVTAFNTRPQRLPKDSSIECYVEKSCRLISCKSYRVHDKKRSSQFLKNEIQFEKTPKTQVGRYLYLCKKENFFHCGFSKFNPFLKIWGNKIFLYTLYSIIL